ncbi:MAG: hypothetical protein FJZ96_14135 [Chloroflexi bacterium]|nr:hypothetical protein [Chloroflexota bacterium]
MNAKRFNQFIGSENFKEWGWVLGASILVLVLASLPTLAGYLAQTPEKVFFGAFFDRQDYAVHLSMMHAGYQGEWSYSLRFTSEPHQPAYIRIFYPALGQLSRLFGASPEVMFQVARLFFGMAALLAIYRLVQQTIRERFWRRLAFLLAAAGSGLGWLVQALGWTPNPSISPIDLWLIDGYVFFGMMLFPHFSAVTAFMVYAVSEFMVYMERGSWKSIPVIGACAILTQLFNPIIFIVADAAIAGFWFISFLKEKGLQKKPVFGLACIALAQVPLLVYSWNILSNDPVWSRFTSQNETLSPPFIYYLLGFGLLWLWITPGLLKLLRKRDPGLLSMLAWLAAAFLLAYSPTEIQRRFLHGITIPFGILAVFGMRTLFEHPRLASRRSFYAILFTGLTLVTSLTLSLRATLDVGSRPDELFYTVDLAQSVDWLAEQGNPDDFVLASETTSQVIAARTGLKVYFGHPMETIDYEGKKAQVTSFYQGANDPGWLPGSPVRFVLFGPQERELAGGEFTASDDMLLVYQNDSVLIYEVER